MWEEQFSEKLVRRGNETVLSSFLYQYQQHLCVPPMSPNLASSGHTCSYFVLFPREMRILSYFLFSQAGLLSHPLGFQHLGIAWSWAFRRHCLKSDQN